MDFPGFVKIERDGAGEKSRVVVARLSQPKLVMEVEVEEQPDGRRRKGAIRRVVAPNSPNGDYGACARGLSQADAFLENALAAEAAGFKGRLG